MNVEDIQKSAAAQQLIFDGLSKTYLQKDLVQTAAYNQELLEAFYLNTNISISQMNDDGSLIYEIYFNQADLINYVEVAEDEEANITLNIKEDDTQNEVIHMADGRVFLDGHEVTVEMGEMEEETNSIMRAGNYDSYGAYSLPKGRSSIPWTYSDTGTYYYANKITLRQTLAAIAIGISFLW